MTTSHADSFKDIAQISEGAIEIIRAPGNRSLMGRRGWILSDGIAGHLSITRGIAETLGLSIEIKPMEPRAPWRYLAPNGPPDPRLLNALLGEAPPDIVLGAGRQTVPFVRALRRAGAFTVLFQSPRTSAKSADLIWVPSHDRLRGPNVISTLTPPHRFSEAALDAVRRSMPPEILALPEPRIAVLLGGPGAGYRYDEADIAAFEDRLSGAAGGAGSFLVTPSRRTPHALLSAADAATRSKPRILWNGQGGNPYSQFLAAASLFIVTADSVNMTGEACATGRSVYIFTPSGGRPKFQRFHRNLTEHGATRPLPQNGEALKRWVYEPLRPTEFVAAEIEAAWLRARPEASHKAR